MNINVSTKQTAFIPDHQVKALLIPAIESATNLRVKSIHFDLEEETDPHSSGQVWDDGPDNYRTVFNGINVEFE